MISGYYKKPDIELYLGDIVKIHDGTAKRFNPGINNDIDTDIGVVFKIDNNGAYIVDMASSNNLVFQVEA